MQGKFEFCQKKTLISYNFIRISNIVANLPTDCGAINKTLTKRGKKQLPSTTSRSVSRQSSVISAPTSPTEPKELPNSQSVPPLEASNYKPVTTAEPGTYKASLMEVPHIDKLTESKL